MTCFWDGINRVIATEFNLPAGVTQHVVMINRLKQLSRNTTIRIRWNGEEISSQMAKEFREWIEKYDQGGINDGHDCSVCDPFLALLCHVLRVDIIHVYNGVTIMYSSMYKSNKIIKFYSNNGHFW